MRAKQAFKLTLRDGEHIDYAKGEEIRDEHADHWYAKANAEDVAFVPAVDMPKPKDADGYDQPSDVNTDDIEKLRKEHAEMKAEVERLRAGGSLPEASKIAPAPVVTDDSANADKIKGAKAADAK